MKKHILLIVALLLLATPAWARMPAYVLGAGGAAAKVEYTVFITDNTTDFNTYTYASITHFAGVEDTPIREPNDANYGSKTVFNLNVEDGVDIHGLLKFSGLSNIPSTATIKSVEIGIYNDSNGGSVTGTFRRLLVNWIEGTQDGADRCTDTPCSSCWTEYGNDTGHWTTAGGLSDGNDRSATTTGTVTLTGAAGWKTITSAQAVTDVQGFVNGTYANYGWHIESTGGPTWANVVTSEGTNGQRPYIKVVYEN